MLFLEPLLLEIEGGLVVYYNIFPEVVDQFLFE